MFPNFDWTIFNCNDLFAICMLLFWFLPSNHLPLRILQKHWHYCSCYCCCNYIDYIIKYFCGLNYHFNMQKFLSLFWTKVISLYFDMRRILKCNTWLRKNLFFNCCKLIIVKSKCHVKYLWAQYWYPNTDSVHWQW